MTERTQTERGFGLVYFSDRYGEKCSLQKSSLASEDAVWLGVHDAQPKILASQATALGVATTETTGWVPYPLPKEAFIGSRMHLTQEMAAWLIRELQHFVDTGELR